MSIEELASAISRAGFHVDQAELVGLFRLVAVNSKVTLAHVRSARSPHKAPDLVRV